MEIICQDYYFYPNNNFSTERKYDSNTQTYCTDINQSSSHIRIYGTLDQINQAGDEYMKRTGCNLDEAYNYCIEGEDSIWYNKVDNKDIAANLEKYSQLYNKNEALIINMV